MSRIDILLVEDNPSDIRFIDQAFKDQEISAILHTVQRGDEALDRLYQKDEFAEVPRPDIVLLDLNLPAISGQTVLEEIKSDPHLKRIPVIILTGSESESELIRAYANACLIKPVDLDEFATLILTFTEFWISTAVLPSTSDSAGNPQR